jgi:hypothetical protein
MNITAKEIIHNIKNLRAGGKQTDDELLSDFQYLWIIDYYRSMLIKQQVNQGQTIGEFMKQNLGYIAIKQTDFDDCLYETVEIPKPIEFHKIDGLTYVGDGDRMGYQRTNKNASHWHDFRKFTSKLPVYYINDGKLVVKHFQGIRDVYVEGVFERPINVIKFNGKFNALDPMEFTYPINSAMLDSLYKLVVDSEIKLSLLLPVDNLNDSVTNVQQGQPQ